MKTKLLIIFCCLAGFIKAQDLHVYYNLYKDSLWYEKNGKPCTNLNVRKGKNVVLHIIEYNNYIYKANVETSYYSVQPPGYGSESNNFLGMLPGLINSLVPGGSAILPMLNTPILGSLMSTFTTTDTSKTSRGEIEEVEDYKIKLNELISKKEEINSLLLELNRRNRSEKLLQGNLSFVNELLMNPNLAPSQIKKIVDAYFIDLLLLEPNQRFEVKDIYPLNDKIVGISNLKSEISSKAEGFSKELGEFKKVHKRLKGSDHGIESLYPLLKDYESQEYIIESFVKNLSQIMVLDTLVTKFDYLSSIQKFYLKYEELQNNSFAIINNVEAKSKFLLFDINIHKRDTSLKSEAGLLSELPVQKSLKVKINTFGDFGFVASAGLAGVGYSNPIESYYIQNNILNAEKQDQFVPYISSLFNVTYQITPNFSPALSFGIGIPMSKSDVLSSISYLVGPSVFFGKERNFALTGGFMFSKIKKLGKNLLVGDTIDVGFGDIPLSSKFESGFFLGISYNLSGNI